MLLRDLEPKGVDPPCLRVKRDHGPSARPHSRARSGRAELLDERSRVGILAVFEGPLRASCAVVERCDVRASSSTLTGASETGTAASSQRLRSGADGDGEPIERGSLRRRTTTTRGRAGASRPPRRPLDARLRALGDTDRAGLSRPRMLPLLQTAPAASDRARLPRGAGRERGGDGRTAQRPGRLVERSHLAGEPCRLRACLDVHVVDRWRSFAMPRWVALTCSM